MKIKVEYVVGEKVLAVTHENVGNVRIDVHNRLVLEKDGRPVGAYNHWTRWEKAVDE